MVLGVVPRFNVWVSKNNRLNKIPKEYREPVKKDLANLAKVIRERRKQLGFTQEELAAILDVEPTTVQSIEQSRRSPSIEMFLSFCRALNLKLELTRL